MIPFTVTMHIGETFSRNAENFAVLGSFGDCDAAPFGKEGGNFFFTTQGRFGKADGDLPEHVYRLARKDRITNPKTRKRERFRTRARIVSPLIYFE